MKEYKDGNCFSEIGDLGENEGDTQNNLFQSKNSSRLRVQDEEEEGNSNG